MWVIAQPARSMDSRDTAPDSWEQEDDVEATAETELQSAFTGLNVNAPEFVPSFLSRCPAENDTSDGKPALMHELINLGSAVNAYSRLAKGLECCFEPHAWSKIVMQINFS